MTSETTQPGSDGVPPPDYRLPEAAHVGGVHLLVGDLSRSRAYYERVIGLQATSADAERVALGAAGGERTLVTLQTRAGITSARQSAFGLYHFALLMPDRAALGRFAAHLSTLDVRVGMADHLVSEAIYLWDPDGLGIEVYADRPRHTWRHQNRQIAMATDPLDVQSVIAAAEDVAWDGAPAGTVMGHVHLHVGDLDRAEAFYHRAIGFDKTLWSYPGALFLSAGGYHHHLGTNTWSPGPAPSANEAQLLEWELMVPSGEDAASVGRSLQAGGYALERATEGVAARDPWGTRVRIRPAR